MFCAPGLLFGCPDGIGCRFLVLRSRTRFRRCRVIRVPFSCFARPDSFSALLRASGPIFMFCAPGLVFGGAEGVESHFHVSCSRTRFLQCRVRRVPFSCFVLPDSFSTVPRALGPVFIFCVRGLVFGGTEGVVFHFHVLHARIGFSAIPRESGPVFMFCAPGLVFGGTEGVGCRFHVQRVQTRFRRYRGRRVLFSFFACPDSFLAVPRAPDQVFMSCAPGLIFGSAKCVGFSFHVLCSWTRFRRY
jgi:hypothetical protein